MEQQINQYSECFEQIEQTFKTNDGVLLRQDGGNVARHCESIEDMVKDMCSKVQRLGELLEEIRESSSRTGRVVKRLGRKQDLEGLQASLKGTFSILDCSYNSLLM